MTETAQEKLEALVARIKKVRRWLLALAILKAAGISMAFVSGYIGVYAWLDHHLNFGIFGRITAFILLLAGSAFLLYKLARYLVTHISCSRAANFIETRHSFHQQLVAAIEFYEGQRDYPYSKTLAEQLVLRVFKETEGFNFDSIINKWHGYVLAAIVLFGLGSVLFYARANYLYISSYFARLTRPLGTVQPLVSTTLQPITRDIVAEPNSPVTFAAEIEGLVPESGKLLLVAAEPNTTDNSNSPEQEEIRILPTLNAGEKAKFNASKSFAQTGVFRYRFETGSASTQWHKVDIHPAPQIESITADVLVPPRPPRNMRVKPYSEQIADQTLEVMPDSSITLSVQATGPLHLATITGLDGQAVTKQFSPGHWPGAKGGADQFTFSFTASRSGTIRFRLEDEFGLANENVPDLQVIVRNDEPPKITLISPEGDYITTDVASVPITFEISDDFGLNTAQIVLEIPRQPPKQLAIPIAEGEKTHTFTHTVELEQYDLRVGDSILFYAQASDIDTGSALPSRNSSSDVYFIEIRPYRQNWHPKPGGGQGSGAAGTAEDLLTILEYTRAILKKTWTIADKSALSDEDRGRLKAINDDVQYCATQLTTMRDDSQYGFDEQAKTVLNQVLQSYSRASGYLAGHNPIAALPPEKDAYGILRKFILELEMLWNPPSSGQSSPQEKPDSVKLQESPEFSPYEKERIEGQLKELQQKLQKVAQEQKLLKTDFVNFLEQQARQEAGTQESKERTSSGAAQSKQSPAKASTSREGTSSSNQKAQEAKAATDGAGSGDGQKPSQGAGPSLSRAQSRDRPGQGAEGKPVLPRGQRSELSQAEGKSDAAGGQPGQGGQSQAQLGDGSTTAKTSGSDAATQQSSASIEARLRMIQAKQKALQEKVSQLKQDLNQLPAISPSTGLGAGSAAKLALSEVEGTQARQKAQEHLEDALAKMDEFQAAVTATRHQPSVTGKPFRSGKTGAAGPVGKAAEAVELMESARQKLEQAGNAIGQGLSMSEEQKLAEKTQEIAEQLAEDANALDESLTPLEKEEMLARLEAAKRLLDSMSGAQWSTVSKGSSRSSPVHVFTKDPRAAPAEAARAMARQFWSIAIEAKKRKSHPFDKLRAGLIEDEPSDVKFYELENRFFENAAKFSKEPVKK
jgi:hypothetical protein